MDYFVRVNLAEPERSCIDCAEDYHRSRVSGSRSPVVHDHPWDRQPSTRDLPTWWRVEESVDGNPMDPDTTLALLAVSPGHFWEEPETDMCGWLFRAADGPCEGEALYVLTSAFCGPEHHAWDGDARTLWPRGMRPLAGSTPGSRVGGALE